MKPFSSILTLALAAALLAPIAARAADAVELGRAIYAEGKLPDGQPLAGMRDNTLLKGKDAACISCHRRSGLGSVEGTEAIPPITGRALFNTGEPVIVRQDKRFQSGASTPLAIPYNALTFAAAVRDGHHISGREMNKLMPRYVLSDAQLEAVAAYLKTLSEHATGGVEGDTIHLATVIAPGADAARRQAFLDTLNALVNQHNVNVHAGLRQKIPVIERKLKTRRKWTLEVRELEGAADTWSSQLDRMQTAHPAFVMLSGLGLDHWQPVQDFCERNHVACWFPSVDVVPQDAGHSSYSLYFSEGMALEAKVIASRLMAEKAPPGKLLQIVAANPLALAGADALEQALADKADIHRIMWDDQHPEQVVSAIRAQGKDSNIAVWAGCGALQSASSASDGISKAFVSSTFCPQDASSVPAQWKGKTWWVERLELGKMREVNLERFKGWSKFRGIPLVDEKMQSEAYAAFNMLSMMLTDMLNNLHTDYLIDRTESTLSMRESMQVQEEVQNMMMGGGGKRPHATPQGEMPTEAPMPEAAHKLDMSLLSKRKGFTAYPRMTLGPGQRFASHGAYLVPACADAKECETAEWVVPDDPTNNPM